MAGVFGAFRFAPEPFTDDPSARADGYGAPRNTPIWKLEAALKCRSCGTRRYKRPVHMIKLTAEREITPYVWTHPDDEDR